MFIWIIGAGDYTLTQALIEQGGIQAESNALARNLCDSLGVQILFAWKLLMLVIFTAIFIVVARRHRVHGARLLRVGVGMSVLLASWWGFLIWTCPVI